MVWSESSIGGRMDLMAQKFADDILKYHVVPYSARIDYFFYLMLDNGLRVFEAEAIQSFGEARIPTHVIRGSKSSLPHGAEGVILVH
ncbi:hypothetical protein TNCV_3400751 [Trichonephila clavipes]|nr:hypothetical protein TNCV_3400751 [Trichonephila clavipes]